MRSASRLWDIRADRVRGRPTPRLILMKVDQGPTTSFLCLFAPAHLSYTLHFYSRLTTARRRRAPGSSSIGGRTFEPPSLRPYDLASLTARCMYSLRMRECRRYSKARTEHARAYRIMSVRYGRYAAPGHALCTPTHGRCATTMHPTTMHVGRNGLAGPNSSTPASHPIHAQCGGTKFPIVDF